MQLRPRTASSSQNSERRSSQLLQPTPLHNSLTLRTLHCTELYFFVIDTQGCEQCFIHSPLHRRRTGAIREAKVIKREAQKCDSYSQLVIYSQSINSIKIGLTGNRRKMKSTLKLISTTLQPIIILTHLHSCTSINYQTHRMQPLYQNTGPVLNAFCLLLQLLYPAKDIYYTLVLHIAALLSERENVVIVRATDMQFIVSYSKITQQVLPLMQSSRHSNVSQSEADEVLLLLCTLYSHD